jgi:nucleoside-diphosphate-sugar epimerase
MRGNSVRLGSLHPTRDLTYVTDTVEGFMLAASRPDCVGKTVNLGSGQEISIDNLVKLIARLVGRPIEVCLEEQRVRPPKSEVERLVADTKKAQQILGWKPSLGLEEGVNKTIEWMQEHQERYPAGAYSL